MFPILGGRLPFSGGDKSDAARGNRAQSFASSPAMIREYDIFCAMLPETFFKHCFPLANIVDGNGSQDGLPPWQLAQPFELAF